MKLTTETVLTSPLAFGLTTATPAQRALCRILDGLPLGELADNEDVREAVGNVEALPTGEPPFEVHTIAAIRTAKSLIAAARIVTLSQSVDADHLGRGDLLRIPLAALKMDGTRAVMSHLVENVQAKPHLRPLLVGEPTMAGVTLRHPSGRPIEVTPIPIDRAGGSALSVWNAGIVVDEEPRMLGAEDGVKNWDHLRSAVLGRILRGGQFLGIGSPHAPFGPVYDLVQENWGRPTADLVIFRARGTVMNPHWWTRERCDDLRRRDPTAYRTDERAEFAEPETSLISATEIDATARTAPLELSPRPGGVYVAAMDPATRGNSWTLVIVDAREARRVVVLARAWTGSRSAPLSPEKVLSEIAGILATYGVRSVYTDQHAADALKDLGHRAGLTIVDVTTTAPLKLEMMSSLATVIASKGVDLSPDPVLRRDLLALRKRITQAGVAIVAPRTSDGRHADYASALALVLHMSRGHAAAASFDRDLDAFQTAMATGTPDDDGWGDEGRRASPATGWPSVPAGDWGRDGGSMR